MPLPESVALAAEAALLEASRRATFADAQRAVWAMRAVASLVSASPAEDRLGVLQLSGALARAVGAILDLMVAVEDYQAASASMKQQQQQNQHRQQPSSAPEGDALGGGERRSMFDPAWVAEAAAGSLHEVVAGFTGHLRGADGLLWALTEGADDDDDGEGDALFPQGRKRATLTRSDLARLRSFVALDA